MSGISRQLRFWTAISHGISSFPFGTLGDLHVTSSGTSINGTLFTSGTHSGVTISGPDATLSPNTAYDFSNVTVDASSSLHCPSGWMILGIAGNLVNNGSVVSTSTNSYWGTNISATTPTGVSLSYTFPAPAGGSGGNGGQQVGYFNNSNSNWNANVGGGSGVGGFGAGPGGGGNGGAGGNGGLAPPDGGGNFGSGPNCVPGGGGGAGVAAINGVSGGIYIRIRGTSAGSGTITAVPLGNGNAGGNGTNGVDYSYDTFVPNHTGYSGSAPTGSIYYDAGGGGGGGGGGAGAGGGPVRIDYFTSGSFVSLNGMIQNFGTNGGAGGTVGTSATESISPFAQQGPGQNGTAGASGSSGPKTLNLVTS